MAFDRRSLVVPDGTRFEEHAIVAPGDVIFGNQTRVEFGLLAQGSIFGGENVRIQGHLQTPAELRLDHFSAVEGDVSVGANCYLGEKSRVEGKLTVGGDLDVGDDVAITKGFEAKGWINIRSPVPVVIYIFLYLLELLRLGKSEDVDKILSDLEQAQEKIPIREGFLYLPDHSSIGLQHSVIQGNLLVGRNCRLLGNYTVHGNVVLGPGTKFYGAIKARGTVKVQATAEVQGTIQSAGLVQIGEEVRVLGDVRAQTVELYQSAAVDGKVVAPGGIKFSSRASLDMEDKVVRFAAGMRDDIVDLLG